MGVLIHRSPKEPLTTSNVTPHTSEGRSAQHASWLLQNQGGAVSCFSSYYIGKLQRSPPRMKSKSRFQQVHMNLIATYQETKLQQ